MLKMILAGAVAVPVAAGSAVVATGVAVVDVREHGSHRIVVPVPLALAHVAAAFVPAHKMRVHMDEKAARYLPLTHELLAALEAAPDAELVRVEEKNERVLIRKDGGNLRIEVEDNGERVDVTVPIRSAMAALPDENGQISASRALFGLQHARLTKLVDVASKNGDHVSVTLY